MRRRHQHLARVRLHAVEVHRRRLGAIPLRRHHVEVRYLKQNQPVRAHARRPALPVLDNREERLGRRHATAALAVRHVRRVARRVDRSLHRTIHCLARRQERAVVVQERAHVQHLVARHAKLRLEVRLHRHRVTDVAKHQAVRHARRAQRRARLRERVLVEVDAAHRERILVEVPATHRLALHEQVDRLEQRPVAAPHVGHHARLRRQRRALAEDRAHARAHHVRKVPVVHEPGADHVQLAVHPALVPVHVSEHLRRIAIARLAQPVEHRAL